MLAYDKLTGVYDEGMEIILTSISFGCSYCLIIGSIIFGCVNWDIAIRSRMPHHGSTRRQTIIRKRKMSSSDLSPWSFLESVRDIYIYIYFTF